MRILHVDTGRLWRGGQAQAYHLARGLQRRGHRNLVVCPPRSPLAQRCGTEEIPVRPCDGRGDLSLRLAMEVWRSVRRFRPDVVHVHTAHAVGPMVAARLLRVPACVVSRRVSFPLRSGPLSRWKYSRLPHRVIAVSRAIGRELESGGITASRIRVVPSGYDSDRFRDLPSRSEARRVLALDANAPLLLFVGALAPHKSVPVLLAAFTDVVRGTPDAKLLLAGDGPLRESIAKEAQRLGVARAVTLLGNRDDIPLLMMASDLVVLPSAEGEGSPAVVKEAMACGRPVVVSFHGGMDEIVDEGETGYLVPPGDAPAMARAIGSLLDDPARRDVMGRNGMRGVARFEIDRMVDGAETVYRELVSP